MKARYHSGGISVWLLYSKMILQLPHRRKGSASSLRQPIQNRTDIPGPLLQNHNRHSRTGCLEKQMRHNWGSYKQRWFSPYYYRSEHCADAIRGCESGITRIFSDRLFSNQQRRSFWRIYNRLSNPDSSRNTDAADKPEANECSHSLGSAETRIDGIRQPGARASRIQCELALSKQPNRGEISG